jgi:hypothetical protein
MLLLSIAQRDRAVIDGFSRTGRPFFVALECMFRIASSRSIRRDRYSTKLNIFTIRGRPYGQQYDVTYRL